MGSKIERMNDWISVKDRLPGVPQQILVGDAQNESTCIGYWHGKEPPDYSDLPCAWADTSVERFTHWLPIPDLPDTDVLKVFRVAKSRIFRSRYWVEHCTWGDVGVYGTRRKAQSICDRLNQLWQLEKDASCRQ